MRIGIEAQRLFRSKKHGMDIVALELIKALQKVDTKNEYFIFVKPGPDTACIAPTPNFKIVEVKGYTYADWEQISLPIAIRKYKLDVLHCTANTAPLFCSVPLVLTLHDVIFFEKKFKTQTSKVLYQRLGNIYRRIIVPMIVKKVKKIITVSNYEKSRIAETFNINAENISVIYNAVGDAFLKESSDNDIKNIKSLYGLPEKYILFIGNTDPKKNTRAVIRSYVRYNLAQKDPLPLVVVDLDKKYISDILTEVDAGRVLKNIISIGYIQNKHLPMVYAGAEMFLYPSLRESFGIPVLEAMACRVPVITSTTSALPEVAGGAALLVNPEDEAQISEDIYILTHNQSAVDTLVEKGVQRVKEFSYVSSAEKLLQLYNSRL